MKLRAIALGLSVLMAATASGFASAAGRGGHYHGPRVTIGIGMGGGFFDPFYDPFWGGGYPAYPAYGHAPAPAVPCTPADVPTKEPSNDPFSPDYAYDRIDAARCAPQPAVPAQAPPAYYFCRSTGAYYPYVAHCAEGWQQVAPKPPGP